MQRKCIVFAAVLLTFCMVNVGSAAVSLIDSFEDGDTTSNPTWVPEGDGTLTVTTNSSPHGTHSLRVDRATSGWSNTMKVEIGAARARASSKLTFSVQALGGAGNDVPSWWAAVVPIWNTDETSGGWNQGPQFDLTLDGAWHKYTWDYSALVDGNLGNDEIPATAGSVQLVLPAMANDTVWKYRLDNIRLIPEPASLSLMGIALGGLLMLRRRG